MNKGSSQSIISSCIGLVGIIIGGLGGYLISENVVKEERISKETSEAYVEVMSGIAATTSMDEVSRAIFEQKIRIAIFGNEEVTKQLAVVNMSRGEEQQKEEIVNLISIMRSQIYSDTGVTKEHIRKITYGK